MFNSDTGVGLHAPPRITGGGAVLSEHNFQTTKYLPRLAVHRMPHAAPVASMESDG